MKNNINNKQYYTVNETSKFLGVTEQTVSKYLRNGELGGVKKGPKNKWHVRGNDIIKKMKEWKMIE